jgi:hypothetical protein
MYNRTMSPNTASPYHVSVIVLRFPAGVKDFSLLRSVNTGSEAHHPAIQWGTGAILLVVNRLGREAGHSPKSRPYGVFMDNITSHSPFRALQFIYYNSNQANAHNSTEVTITLQHTSRYMFRTLLVHHQGAQNCTKMCAFVGSKCDNFASLYSSK